MSRIGVFLCNCGNEISRMVNTEEVEKAIKDKEDVVFTLIHPHLCDEAGLERMKVLISENKIERVVVGACSPQLYLETFRQTVNEAGINPFLLEMVNLREQCSWVHQDGKASTQKAKRLMSGAINKIAKSVSIEPQTTKISRDVLVIGGGVAGTNAAMELAKKGIKTYLVESQPWIGGVTAQVGMAFPTDDCAYCIGARSELGGIRKCFYRAGLSNQPNLKIITNTKVKEVAGEMGHFKVVLETAPTFVNENCISCRMCEEVCPIEVKDEFNRGLTTHKAIYKQFEAVPNKYIIDFENCNMCKECLKVCPEEGAIDFGQRPEKEELTVGAIVIATGIDEFNPTGIGEYGYKEHEGVLTQLDLARYLDPSGPTRGKLAIEGKTPQSITMIQCVGSRDERYHTYCSRLCCMMALKHAILIKKRYPKIRINVCYIDIRTTGIGYEDWYNQARDLGVIFLHGKPSEVRKGPDGGLIVRTEDVMLGEAVELPSDLVVLSSGIESSKGTKEIAAVLGLDLDKDEFIKVMDPKVRSLATTKSGVFICGGARGPTDIPESVIQAKAAISDVTTLLSKDEIVDFRIHPEVNTDLCDGCEVCTIKCPFGAIRVDLAERKSYLNRDLCYGCGICASNCPNGAVQLLNYTDEQIFAQLEGILSTDGDDPVVIGFVCEECGYASIDLAGVERFHYSERVNLIPIRCTGRLSAIHILKAFELGAAGVAVVGCMEGRCHYQQGLDNVKNNIALAEEALAKNGMEDRIRLMTLCGARSHDFVTGINDFVEKVVK